MPNQNQNQPTGSLVLYSVSESDLQEIQEARSWEIHEPGSAPDRLLRSLAGRRIQTDEDLVESGRSALARKYRDEIRTSAKEILSEILDSRDAEDESPDDLRERIEERIWEFADGSAWTIYTSRALSVLSISDNADYTVSEFGTDGLAESFADGTIWSRLAFIAIYADTSEIVWQAFSAYEERRETWESALVGYGLSLDSIRLVDSGSAYADRYGLEITLPDETVLRWSLSENANEPGGVCISVDALSFSGVHSRSVSIVSPSVSEGVRIQTLRLLESVRESVRAEFEALERARAEYEERESAGDPPGSLDPLADSIHAEEERLSPLLEFAGLSRIGA